ncbi:MAG TPA: SUF system NifU family Fe-S cluster assembly protein [Thermoplasmata archaeon]|jgi:nitrogen fixation NifU-like protein|nr:SUF system NifU family Fe-S cluster assembly protein [Thermoplasmata archaeon]
MADLRELYQEVILDHSRSPRNYHKIDPSDRTADGTNPLCGDRVTLYVKLEGGTLADVAFQGQGCAISKSSASMMTDALKGKTEAEARALFEEFHEMVTGHGKPDAKALGKLTVFAGVSEFPARVKCASLAWHTLKAALDKSDKVTME